MKILDRGPATEQLLDDRLDEICAKIRKLYKDDDEVVAVVYVQKAYEPGDTMLVGELLDLSFALNNLCEQLHKVMEEGTLH